jgi:hypothetical protein
MLPVHLVNDEQEVEIGEEEEIDEEAVNLEKLLKRRKDQNLKFRKISQKRHSACAPACLNQGGQIGRIFAYWAIVYIGQVF